MKDGAKLGLTGAAGLVVGLLFGGGSGGEDAIEDLGGRMNMLERSAATVSDIDGRISSIESAVSALGKRASSIEESVAALADLPGATEGVAASVAALNEATGDLGEQISAVSDSVDSSMAELRSATSDLAGQVATLSVPAAASESAETSTKAAAAPAPAVVPVEDEAAEAEAEKEAAMATLEQAVGEDGLVLGIGQAVGLADNAVRFVMSFMDEAAGEARITVIGGGSKTLYTGGTTVLTAGEDISCTVQLAGVAGKKAYLNAGC